MKIKRVVGGSVAETKWQTHIYVINWDIFDWIDKLESI